MLTISILDHLGQIDPAAWDALVGAHDPFIEHAFLHGLEASGSVGSMASGWLPRHVVVRDGTEVVGAIPLYEKYDSYGEFIFDWSWAQAAQGAGLAYYPKLVAAVPFTPATGPRLLIAPQPGANPGDNPGANASAIRAALMRGVAGVAEAIAASSIHLLFLPEAQRDVLATPAFMPRLSFQFHWDRQPHWHTFDDFLAALRAPSRKAVRRERSVAASHGLRLSMQRGPALTDADWQALYGFYRRTSDEKGAQTYLTPDFFTYMRTHLAHRVVAALAHRGTTPVAGALYFTKGNNLYGRYWGSHEPLDCLHFELCYYQPIAWALANGVQHFEAGAQGEHKLKRGLMPAACHSLHWIRHPGLAAAIADFLPREAAAVTAQMQAYAAHGPYGRAQAPTA